MIVKNNKLKIRKLTKKDGFLLAKWLSDSRVLQYYEGRDHPFDIEKVNEKFFDCTEEVKRCIIIYESIPIGYIQFYLVCDDSKDLYGYPKNEIIYGLDQFIGEVEYWNKGIGTKLIKTMVEYLIVNKNADLIVMDPQVSNVRALRCYEKCGFKTVKLLPNNELHEGEYRDCFLIEYRK